MDSDAAEKAVYAFQSHQIGIETDAGENFVDGGGTFNRTRLELKLYQRQYAALDIRAFNRTRLELKPPTATVMLPSPGGFQSHQIGIETRVYLLLRVLHRIFQSHQIGIETLKARYITTLPTTLSIAPDWN